MIFPRQQMLIIFLSIKSKIFPDPFKLAKMKPIFKKGSRMDPSNYRPISLLPLISKIFEKIVHDQMIDYLVQYNILYKYQSVFRTKHSTDLCLSYLNDKILKDFVNGLFTGMILIDHFYTTHWFRRILIMRALLGILIFAKIEK